MDEIKRVVAARARNRAGQTQNRAKHLQYLRMRRAADVEKDMKNKLRAAKISVAVGIVLFIIQICWVSREGTSSFERIVFSLAPLFIVVNSILQIWRIKSAKSKEAGIVEMKIKLIDAGLPLVLFAALLLVCLYKLLVGEISPGIIIMSSFSLIVIAVSIFQIWRIKKAQKKEANS